MMTITDSPLFGIALCVASFYLMIYLRKRVKKAWLNPLIFSTAIIIFLLSVFNIPYEHFKQGGDIIHSFLAPVTVVLALPLYRQRKMLKKYYLAIFSGVLAGVLSSLLSIIILADVFSIGSNIERSLLSHSVTTPIAVSLSEMLSANEGIAIVAVVLTGVFGTSVAPLILQILRIKHPVAKGLSIGTATHALGTSRAVEMGDTEGAMSGLAIGVAALVTIAVVVLFQAVGIL